jgi:hypothetical protein
MNVVDGLATGQIDPADAPAQDIEGALGNLADPPILNRH